MSKPKPLLTEAVLVQLLREIKRDEKIVADASGRILANKRKYEAGLMFAPDFDPERAEKGNSSRRKRKKSVKKIVKIVAAPAPSLTWRGEIKRVAYATKGGIEYPKALELLLQTELGKSPSKGYKGFWTAIDRLVKAGELFRHGKSLLSPKDKENLEAAGVDFANGGRSVRFGPAGSIVLDTLDKHGTGLTGRKLQEVVAAVPGVTPSMIKHKHYIYNVLKPLVKSGLVLKVGELYKLAVPRGARH